MTSIVAAIWLASAVSTGCGAYAQLAARYGVSVMGFSSPISVSPQPVLPDGKPWLILNPRQEVFKVSDGFSHVFYVDTSEHRAWIYRTGGIAGVSEWYGPVSTAGIDLASCTPSPAPPAA